MGFTQGYKVNADTQYEFTVSNETLAEVVQGGGITDGDLSEYCYTALIDSRVCKLMAPGGSFSWPDTTGAAFASYALTCCPGILEGWDQALTSAIPSFNKQLLDSSDQVYQRNFLVWEGTIYPGTENEKQGTFLVMDMTDIKRWYCNFDRAGFEGANQVTSGIGETPPEGYVWPGYTGTVYGYHSNGANDYPDILCDNNNPQLNPNTNLKVQNVLIINGELWVGSLNPSTHGTSDMGGSGCSYAGRSLYGWYWNGSSYAGYLTQSSDCYQKGTMEFMALPDYSNAPALLGAPRGDVGSLTYQSYAVCGNDNMVVNLTGNWGQQNYSTGVSFVNNCKTTTEGTLLKWQSWCGIKFQYNGTMYKPIIEGGIIVGYSDDMDAESEYDDMTNVTGNDIPSGPPKPPPEPDEDDPWHGVNYGSGGYGASPFCTSYAMTGAELSALAEWGGKTEEQGGPKAGYDYMPSIISLVEMPMEVSGTVPSTVKFSRGTLGGYDSNIVDTGVSGNPITAGTQRYNLGSVTLPLKMANRGYPFLDWDTVVELYMPFIGVFSLDPFAVLGKTITAFMDLDVLNGTICGYAYVTNNGEKLPVAYGSAQVGVSLPVTSEGAATARLALTTANAQLGSSIASGVLQLGALASIGGSSSIKSSGAWTSMQSARSSGLAAQTGRNIFAGGASDAITGYAKSNTVGSVANSFTNWGLSLRQLQSSNNTQVNGSMGGGSFSGWSTPNQAYVKIIRPHAAPGAKATEYGKTHAYPYEANATLASCKGLTFAVNPNVSGITKATDAERSQIAELLMGGVIA